MRYIGSKLRLVEFIENTVKKYCGEDLSDKVFCDIFAGTGVVGRSFSPMVKKVISNDFEKYSFVANYVGLKGFSKDVVEDYLRTLNSLHGIKNSSLFNAYSEGGKSGRLYFSEGNGAKVAHARAYIDDIGTIVGFDNYMALLLAVIEGADKVANTMSTYGAYAKKLKSNSDKEVVFTLPKTAENASHDNEVYMCDSNELIQDIKGDILYLDPPYNARQYGSNYHLLNALTEGFAPDSDSVTGVNKDGYNKSKYCRKSDVGKALDNLIENSNFEWIFLSYNNEGLLSFDEIKGILSKYGDYSVEATEYQRYKADSNRKQAANGVMEYIHVLHKGVFTEKNVVPETDPYLDAVKNMQNTVEEEPSIKLKTKITLFSEFEDEDERGTVYPEEVVESYIEQHSPEEMCGELEHFDTNVAEPVPDTVVSPMNYMGGKKKLINTLKEYFPKNIPVFLDLFCGGATVGVNVDAATIVFNDNIEPLIEMYKFMYTHSAEECLSYIDAAIERYGLVQGEEGKDNYYNFRDNYYNALPVEERHPLDLFVLMAYSFNNQIRFAVNKNWKFNIPFGANRSSFNGKMRENLIGFINALHNKNCVFSARDFKDVPYFAPDMFVYADPPYLISQATYNDGWGEDNELDLLDRLTKWGNKGIKFALSNVLENKGETNVILKTWAEKHGYKVIHLDKSYANSYYQRKEKESKTDEVLIINYEP